MIVKMTFYVCDPEKNTACRKDGCFRGEPNSEAACRMTKHVEFAKTDTEGKPIIVFVKEHTSD